MAGHFCKAVNLYSQGGKIYGVGTNVYVRMSMCTEQTL